MTRARTIADYAKQTTDLATQTELDAAETALGFQSVPHIVPGVLQPSYVASGTSNKLLDGVTAHSGAFGTAQSDGRKYYYTNIAGSKPIKDPRIGGHFGSQRYFARSIQLLEQETATHGDDIYSIDGREWCRAIGSGNSADNGSNGNVVLMGTQNTDYIEITGYFSDVNVGMFSGANRTITYQIDGGTASSAIGSATVNQPLGGRYVSAFSTFNLGVPASSGTPSLGIHTIKIRRTGSSETYFGYFELIAHEKFTDATCDYNNDPTITHDANTRIVAGLTVTGTGIPANATVASVTSSTEFELSAATTGGAVTNGTLTFGTNNIQIPSQNVVSYGKKFTVSDNPHYDPFNGFTSGNLAAVQALIDTDTSLGIANWLHSGSYYRPYNGGRVVKWVASDGTIKTSVNMMPPNARSIGNSSSLTNATAKANASIANNTFYPTFEAGAIDNSLSEVAKTFHWREFGNGAANGGSPATYADGSMLDGADDIAYVMDDGLTSLSGHNLTRESTYESFRTDATDDFYNVTFIGTGLTLNIKSQEVTFGSTDDYDFIVDGVIIKTYDSGDTLEPLTVMVQNLPYGTHTFRMEVKATPGAEHMNAKEFTFHQPKKPPIPEEAVVLADYMLMADFVPLSGSIYGGKYISKGVRGQAFSRDIFADSNVAWDSIASTHATVGHPYGFRLVASNNSNSATAQKIRIPSFATNFVARTYQFGTRKDLYIDTTIQSSNQTIENSPNSTAQYDTWAHLTTSQTLGLYNFGINAKNGQSINASAFEIATPIHTSSHYQPFETPYLHELVGGDRNMEQTNLVVTPDGKTWDELRDTSYIGDTCVQTTTDSETTWATAAKFDEWRGMSYTYNPLMNKDFAIAYDRIICLVDGEYTITVTTRASGTGEHASINVSGQEIINANLPTDNQNFTLSTSLPLKRGNYVMFKGSFGTSLAYNRFIITRL